MADLGTAPVLLFAVCPLQRLVEIHRVTYCSSWMAAQTMSKWRSMCAGQFSRIMVIFHNLFFFYLVLIVTLQYCYCTCCLYHAPCSVFAVCLT